MLPDTFMGGVTLSIVNMAVVFVVLGGLAVIIRLIHTAVSKLGLDSDVAPTPNLPGRKSGQSQAAVAAAAVAAAETMDVSPAADSAPSISQPAVSHLSDSPHTDHAVFLRDTKDSGAWGRSGGPRGILCFGAYRSSQFVCEEQPAQAAAGDH